MAAPGLPATSPLSMETSSAFNPIPFPPTAPVVLIEVAMAGQAAHVPVRLGHRLPVQIVLPGILGMVLWAPYPNTGLLTPQVFSGGKRRKMAPVKTRKPSPPSPATPTTGAPGPPVRLAVEEEPKPGLMPAAPPNPKPATPRLVAPLPLPPT